MKYIIIAASLLIGGFNFKVESAMIHSYLLAESNDTKFQLYIASDAPPKALEVRIKSRIHDNMSLSQVVNQLGVGWMSFGESVGFIYWFFSDNTQLRILPHTYQPDEILSFTGKGGTSKMWLEKRHIPVNTNLTRRSSGTPSGAP